VRGLRVAALASVLDLFVLEPANGMPAIKTAVRITLVISSLAGGGAERVATNMANYWAGKGWKITILTLFHGAGAPAYDIVPEVVHSDLRLSTNAGQMPDREPLIECLIALRGILANLSGSERDSLLPDLILLGRLRHAIKNTHPDSVISFIELTNIRVLLATMGLDLPVIVSEHCDPNFNSVSAGIDLLRRRLYPAARYVVTLTDEAMSFFAGVTGIRGKVIPNPALPAICLPQDKTDTKKNGMVLLGMGRLSHEKGFDLLLRAFAIIKNQHPRWSLEVWGQGPLLASLERLTATLGLSDRTRFRGFTRTPSRAMRRADLFVLSSLCEGFPNVLCEAMASGLPVVSFDCPSGPRHIIRHDIDGLLVEPCNISALAEALDRLMGDDKERMRLASRAPEVVSRFAIEKTMDIWEQALTSNSGAMVA